ncbi:hydroxyproline dehydrogenase isoform X3 [Mesocricetus auratus]|uniref:Proline dehydrogenase n=1 Tax=Mesocricetus auratus TaxID=10036 RepID=A0ABM2WTB3_MESAU|nr:hydroxyproline dehydrogenase isoform X3 [Mesocricetus auratus]
MLWTPLSLCCRSRPSAGGWQPLRFDGGAFHLKGTAELARALLVLRVCAWPPLVTHGLAFQAWSQRLLGSRLSRTLLRASIYGQFVAGETAEEVRDCVQQLQALGLLPLLAVPTEEEPDSTAKTSEAWYEGNLRTMLRCVDLSRALVDTRGPARNSLMQLKVTALASTRLCKELSAWIQRPAGSSQLSPERLAEAMDSGQNLRLSYLSADQNQHLQASLSRLHHVAQETQERLERDAEAAHKAGLAFGVKLVRGAYLEKERAMTQLHGKEDCTQPDYEATSRSYSRCLELVLRRVSRHGPPCHLMVASHNEESVRQATKRMWELGIPPDGPVCFGQLLGMCDHVSLALGQAGYVVYKSIPYGCLEEVIPYLIRRAQENRSVLQGVRREQELLSQELWRRLLGRKV